MMLNKVQEQIKKSIFWHYKKALGNLTSIYLQFVVKSTDNILQDDLKTTL